jgi:hypothetical protein
MNDEIEERAAIKEFDAGMTRPQAEAEARSEYSEQQMQEAYLKWKQKEPK